ncbi:MAG TPA: hypothetical protein VK973_04950 [Arenicellales bacterium]|nr:hypothetical protein [Arenicellales bacterium]
MSMSLTKAIVAATAIAALGGCNPIHEPWDSTGYFEEDRARSEQTQEQLRDRVANTQRGV